MKKKLVLFFFIIGFIVLGTDLKSYGVSSEIEEVILKYFSNELEEKKVGVVIENVFILEGSPLSKYNREYSKVMVDFYKGIGVSISDYSISIVINSVEEGNGEIKLDLDKLVKLKYRGREEYSEYIDNHIVYLRRTNGSIYVEMDIYDKGVLARELLNEYRSKDKISEYINEKIVGVKERSESLNDDISKYRELSLGRNSRDKYSVEGYNGEKAAKWAVDNVYEKAEYDGDCTNFISKALNFGGLKEDRTWYRGSGPWIRVIELRNYLVNTGKGKEEKSGGIGDVVQLCRRGTMNVWGWQHSLMITSVGENGEIFVSAHTNPARNVGLWEYYPSDRWEKIRILHILN